ncbi:hypothetical protein GJ496_003746 [Pomphorhynchus laevis]|nr:hypothetical protein GJ496_003746 [Pomphorhynchus laevis]
MNEVSTIECMIHTALRSIASCEDTQLLGYWERKLSAFIHHEEFCDILLRLVLNSDEQPSVRHLASIVLKRFLASSWDKDELNESEKSDLCKRQDTMRSILLHQYSIQVDDQIEKCLADIVSEVAAFTGLFPNDWPELFHKIVNDLTGSLQPAFSESIAIVKTSNTWLSHYTTMRSNFRLIISMIDNFVLDKDNLQVVTCFMDITMKLIDQLSARITSQVNPQSNIVDKSIAVLDSSYKSLQLLTFQCLDKAILAFTRLLHLHVRYGRLKCTSYTDITVRFLKASSDLISTADVDIHQNYRQQLLNVRIKILRCLLVFHRMLQNKTMCPFQRLYLIILKCNDYYCKMHLSILSQHQNESSFKSPDDIHQKQYGEDDMLSRINQFLHMSLKFQSLSLINSKQKNYDVSWLKSSLGMIADNILNVAIVSIDADNEATLITEELTSWQNLIRGNVLKFINIVIDIFPDEFKQAWERLSNIVFQQFIDEPKQQHYEARMESCLFILENIEIISDFLISRGDICWKYLECIFVSLSNRKFQSITESIVLGRLMVVISKYPQLSTQFPSVNKALSELLLLDTNAEIPSSDFFLVFKMKATQIVCNGGRHWPFCNELFFDQLLQSFLNGNLKFGNELERMAVHTITCIMPNCSSDWIKQNESSVLTPFLLSEIERFHDDPLTVTALEFLTCAMALKLLDLTYPDNNGLNGHTFVADESVDENGIVIHSTSVLQYNFLQTIMNRLKELAEGSFKESYNAEREGTLTCLLELIGVLLLNGHVKLHSKTLSLMTDIDFMSIIRTIIHIHYTSCAELFICVQNCVRGLLHRDDGTLSQNDEIIEAATLILTQSLNIYSAQNCCKYIDMLFAPFLKACLSYGISGTSRKQVYVLIHSILRNALSKAFSCTVLQEKAAVLGIFAVAMIADFQDTINFLLYVPGPDGGSAAEFIISEILWIFPYVDVQNRQLMYTNAFIKIVHVYCDLLNEELPPFDKSASQSKLRNLFMHEVFGDLLSQHKNDLRMTIVCDGKYWTRIPAYAKIVKLLVDVLDHLRRSAIYTGNTNEKYTRVSHAITLDMYELCRLKNLSINERSIAANADDSLDIICSDEDINAEQDQRECIRRSRILRRRQRILCPSKLENDEDYFQTEDAELCEAEANPNSEDDSEDENDSTSDRDDIARSQIDEIMQSYTLIPDYSKNETDESFFPDTNLKLYSSLVQCLKQFCSTPARERDILTYINSEQKAIIKECIL